MIKVAFTDFWRGFEHTGFKFTKTILENFDIEVDYENPDIVVCSIFGKECLKYNVPRLCYIGEAKNPEFNIYDYVIGFDHIQFNDRYLRIPIYYFSGDNCLDLALKKHLLPDSFFEQKSEFCNYVVSSSKSKLPRDDFFIALNKRKHVDSCGNHLNNMKNHFRPENKIEFTKKYKFNIAFENSFMEGYITEKICDAFAAGAIPIYYGGGNGVEKDFNEKAFIDVNKFSSFDDVIDYVLYLDNDHDAYMKMIREPAVTENLFAYEDHQKKLLNFLKNIFEDRFGEKRRSADTTIVYDKEAVAVSSDSKVRLLRKIENHIINKNQ